MSESPVPGGRTGTLTGPRIAFMVIAAVAGTPATYALVGLVLLCFAGGHGGRGPLSAG